MSKVEASGSMPSTPSTSGAGSKGSTPTTATKPSSSNGSNASQSRRPPRKSTLTQQQKNQKRQRATQDQLVLLEAEFEQNPTPSGPVRERIAQEINMTERSVQIWFQNRRAKIKLLTKKTIENGEDCDAIPESYRKYLALQALDAGKHPGALLGTGAGPHGQSLLLGEGQAPQKVIIQHFQCRSLSIGTWRRVGQNAMDLVTFYSLGDKPCLTYYINNESAGYKIEFPFAYIKNITLENGQGDEPNSYPAGLVLELNRPPNFFMDSSGGGGFFQCGDFTENQQASQVLVHHLGGDPRVLSGQLAKLTLLESFQNRHHHFFDAGAVAISAPVSPVGQRPASQPNVMPEPSPSMFPDATFGMSLQPPRGHKRTRSRSVPAITDFSFLQQPMPSFHIQHPSTTITDPSIFAPIPQHPNSFNPSSTLRIDTARSYGLDYRQCPLSATTNNSPSDFASPGFYPSNPAGSSVDSMPSATFNPCYSLPFLSPMPEAASTIAPSASPLSALSPGEPIIADHSPPLSHIHRSASADFLSMPQESAGLSEDGMMLTEMYSKQNLNLPIRSPVTEEPRMHMLLHESPPNEEIDVKHMLPFGTIDPAQLSPNPLSV